jgi:hypothetical protein
MYLKTQSSHLPKETGSIWSFVQKYTERIPTEGAAQENSDKISVQNSNSSNVITDGKGKGKVLPLKA